MIIKVSGNKLFYQNSGKETIVEYSLKGNPTLSYDEDFTLFKDNIPIVKHPQVKIFELSERIKGCDFSEVADVLVKYGLDKINHDQILNATEQEIGLVKSIFLIYQWTEYAFPVIDDNEIDLCSNVFDEFVIDVNNKFVSQRDIYFLPQNYGTENIQIEINNLTMLNLLCYFEIKHEKIDIKNYFIPLIKPGISKQQMLGLDPTGKTHSLWLRMLNNRDAKLRKTFNHD